MNTTKGISNLSLELTIVIVILMFFKFSPWQYANTKGRLIQNDVISYYAYLPATFIQKDLSLSFTKENYSESESGYFWPEETESGGLVIKTTMGLSILYAPFFFLARLFTHSNGFGYWDEFFLSIGSLTYLIIGLICLRKILLKFFDDRVVAFTIPSILFGTNMLYYLLVESLMPHVFNFSLISVFLLYGLDILIRNYSWRRYLLLGLCFGLIVLIRPVNGVVILIPILYALSEKKWKHIIANLKTNTYPILLAFILAFVVILPQLVYWKMNSAHFFFNSYVGERFYFLSPHVIEGLFGFRKGWFIYTPLALFGIIGVLTIRRSLRLSLILFWAVTLYVTFSWWNWWYGGGFSARSLIDFYGVLSLSLAGIINKFMKYKVPLTILLGLLIGLNLFQSYQKKANLIHWDSMTYEAYQIHFLKLRQHPNFEDALKKPNTEAALDGETE